MIISGAANDVTSHLISRAIAQQLPGQPRRLIVDLRHVSLLAPAAVSELVATQSRGETHNFDVALVAPSDAALRALEVSGVGESFVIHATIEEALPA